MRAERIWRERKIIFPALALLGSQDVLMSKFPGARPHWLLELAGFLVLELSPLNPFGSAPRSFDAFQRCATICGTACRLRLLSISVKSWDAALLWLLGVQAKEQRMAVCSD